MESDRTDALPSPWRASPATLVRAFLILIIGALIMQVHPRASAAWVEHKDPSGVTLSKPADWQVRADAPGEIVVTAPQGTAAALVRARIARGDLVKWLQQRYPATEPGLQNVRMLKVEAQGAQVARAAFDYGGNGFQGRASVIAVRHGDVATLFVAAAARQEFAQRLPELTRILDSVRFHAPVQASAPQSATGALQYARWVDPMEGAVSADLPAGWHTEGGLRRSTWNVRLAFTSTSPDGAMMLFSGDTWMPRMFIEPNATTRSLGNAEGQYTGPDGQMILPFQRAEDFGTHLARNRFGAQVTGTRPRPDLVEIARRNPLLQGGASTASAADIEFRLKDGRIGVLTLTTFGAAMGNVGATWWADGVHGFIAPVDRTAQAAAALVRMLTTSRENPQWAAGEREHQVRMGDQYQAYLNWSRQLQQQTIEQRWATDDARQRGMRDILGGTVRLKDPTTGETFETTARDRYYFRVNPADRPTAIGTDTDFKPVSNLDLTRLLQIGTEVPDR